MFNADLPLLSSRCSVGCAGDCSWAHSLIPARQTSRLPFLPAGTFAPTEKSARHWSLLPVHLVRISTAHLLPEESAAAAPDSPSPIWSLPAHTAPSPWCCHNDNEMNCKFPINLSQAWMWILCGKGTFGTFVLVLEKCGNKSFINVV